MHSINIGLLFFSLFIIKYCHAQQEPNKIKQTDIQSLKLSKGLWTTGRRENPVLQLKCTGGTYKCYKTPDEVDCFNRGLDDRGAIQWECTAILPKGVIFGYMSVSCEGYENKKDPYVLIGSCGLEYHLDSMERIWTARDIVTILVVIVVVIACITMSIVSWISYGDPFKWCERSNSTTYSGVSRGYRGGARSGGGGGGGGFSSGFASTSNR